MAGKAKREMGLCDKIDKKKAESKHWAENENSLFNQWSGYVSYESL
jgi:hypothetical protein